MKANIENRGTYIYIEINGQLKKDDTANYNEARQLALDAMTLADQTGIDKVFCNAGNLSGDIPLSARLSFSLFLANKNIELLVRKKRVFKVAFLAEPALLDPGKIGVTILRNRGMNVLVTSEMNEAVRWLGIDTPVRID